MDRKKNGNSKTFGRVLTQTMAENQRLEEEQKVLKAQTMKNIAEARRSRRLRQTKRPTKDGF